MSQCQLFTSQYRTWRENIHHPQLNYLPTETNIEKYKFYRASNESLRRESSLPLGRPNRWTIEFEDEHKCVCWSWRKKYVYIIYIYKYNINGTGTSATIIIMIMLVVYRQLSVLWVHYGWKTLTHPQTNVVMFIRTCYEYILFSVLTQVPSDWSKKLWNRQVETRSSWKGIGLVNYHFYGFRQLTSRLLPCIAAQKGIFGYPKRSTDQLLRRAYRRIRCEPQQGPQRHPQWHQM